MILENGWIGYVTRTYQQVKDEVLTDMHNKVPEITDHTESNLFVKIIGIWAAIGELLHYYIDNSVRELYLSTARQYESAVKLSKMFDYRLKGVIPATGNAVFYTDDPVVSDTTIPINTIIKTENDIEFVTTGQGYILAGENSVTLPIKQLERVPETLIGTSNATPNQAFALETGVADKSIEITVNGESYEFVETFAYSSEGDKVFYASINDDKEMEVVFGDGINGFIPPFNAEIKAVYSLSLGYDGNVAENSITTLKQSIRTAGGQEVKVYNVGRTSGGHGIESLEDLKKLLPLSIRTLNRAVTFQDYIDIAELQSGVSSAGVVFKCGKTVDVYIVPEGGGVATQQLLDSVKDAYYDETRMVTTAVRVLPAGEIKLSIIMDAVVKNVFNRNDTISRLREAILNYVNVENRKIGGGLFIGNLYEVAEAVRGIDHTELKLVVPTPYARIVNGERTLNWDRELNTTSNEQSVWQITYTINDEFLLQKNGEYNGTYFIGNRANFEELSFTILAGDYEPGDSWEFYTYPYNSSLELNEASVFRLDNEDLTINESGGI